LLLRLAKSYLSNGNNPLARDTAIRAAESLTTAGDCPTAISTIETFCTLMPEDNDLVHYLAELLVRGGNNHAASRRLVELARAHAVAGAPDKAEEVFGRALQISSGNSVEVGELAEILRETGKSDQRSGALLRVDGFQETRADGPSATHALSDLLAEMPEDIPAIETAIDQAERLKRTDLANQWRLRLATVCRNLGDVDREAQVLQEILQQDPQQETALQHLILADLDRGNHAAAVGKAQRMAAYQAADGRPAAALTTLRMILDRTPPQDGVLTEAIQYAQTAGDLNELRSLGLQLLDLLETTGQAAEALSLATQLTVILPDHPELHHRRIHFLGAMGRTEAMPAARIQLATALERSNQVEAAKQELTNLLEERPTSEPIREEIRGLLARMEPADQSPNPNVPKT
jgi:tetratricopeptide (TPR) repeat protein